MKRETKAPLKLSDKKKIQDAEKIYRRIWSEVEPFVKPRKLKHYSTVGEWKVAAHKP